MAALQPPRRFGTDGLRVQLNRECVSVRATSIESSEGGVKTAWDDGGSRGRVFPGPEALDSGGACASGQHSEGGKHLDHDLDLDLDLVSLPLPLHEADSVFGFTWQEHAIEIDAGVT